MPLYTLVIINTFPEAIVVTSVTPAANHLFKTRVEVEARKLPEEQVAVFHRTIAQLLFLSGRARQDIQTAMAFLTTWEKGPDEDDWGKLKRVMWYLNETIELKLSLSLQNMSLIQW